MFCDFYFKVMIYFKVSYSHSLIYTRISFSSTVCCHKRFHSAWVHFDMQIFLLSLFFFGCATRMWGLSSLIRNPTHVPCIGSTES